MKYHVLVVAEGKRFGLSTSCLYLSLAGEFKSTGKIEIPRGDYDVIFEVRYRMTPRGVGEILLQLTTKYLCVLSFMFVVVVVVVV